MSLDQTALNQLFFDARTFSHWLDRPVSSEILHRLWELIALAPTSANCSPARIRFIQSPEAKAKLVPCLSPGNVEKTLKAPITALIAYDLQFYENLPQLFPHADAKSWFVGNDTHIQNTAFRNSSLQGAYLILAARALGLDCGPMSGFDETALNAAFFPDETVKINFLCNLGYGDRTSLHPRLPRLTFAEACQIL